jgi:hypothetical protein
MNKEVIADALLEIFRTCIESIIMPTGKLLLPTLGFSFIITAVSFCSELFDVAHFIEWEGAAIATVLLLGLCIIEKGEENEVSRMYRAAQSRVTGITRRRKNAGACDEIEGHTDGIGTSG